MTLYNESFVRNLTPAEFISVSRAHIDAVANVTDDNIKEHIENLAILFTSAVERLDDRGKDYVRTQ